LRQSHAPVGGTTISRRRTGTCHQIASFQVADLGTHFDDATDGFVPEDQRVADAGDREFAFDQMAIRGSADAAKQLLRQHFIWAGHGIRKGADSQNTVTFNNGSTHVLSPQTGPAAGVPV
jgi:hypothetical protein